jgi:hypothetical protein
MLNPADAECVFPARDVSPRVPSEQAKAFAPGDLINRLTGKVNVREGLAGSVQAVLGDLLGVVGSPKAFVVFEELSTDRVFLWEAARSRSDKSAEIRTLDLPDEQRSHYLFPVPREVTAWELTKTRNKKRPWLASPCGRMSAVRAFTSNCLAH